jgi:hypothetical protein
MEQIDYKNINDKIVEQAYASAQVLNEEQKRNLIQAKIERASAHYYALQNSPVWRTDS